jgi:hypothetical protein
MPDFLCEGLAWHIATFPNDEWVFPAEEGGHLRYDNVRRRVWKRAVAAAGLGPLTFHQLARHRRRVHDQRWADPLQIKRRMGPSRTTFETYGHLFPDREEELVVALDRRQKATQIREVDSLGHPETLARDRKRLTRGFARGPEGSRTPDLTRARGKSADPSTCPNTRFPWSGPVFDVMGDHRFTPVFTSDDDQMMTKLKTFAGCAGGPAPDAGSVIC